MVFLQREVGVARGEGVWGGCWWGCGRGPEDVVVVGEEGEEDAEEEAGCCREGAMLVGGWMGVGRGEGETYVLR